MGVEMQQAIGIWSAVGALCESHTHTHTHTHIHVKRDQQALRKVLEDRRKGAGLSGHVLERLALAIAPLACLHILSVNAVLLVVSPAPRAEAFPSFLQYCLIFDAFLAQTVHF